MKVAREAFIDRVHLHCRRYVLPTAQIYRKISLILLRETEAAKMALSWKVSRAYARQFSSGAHLGHVENAGETASMWKKLFFIVAIPSIGLGMLNCYLASQNEEEHKRPPYVPYEHLRIRTKRYPWGDGQRTLFHNPHVNALPSGYEDEH